MVRLYEIINEVQDNSEQQFLQLFKSHDSWVRDKNYTFENGVIDTMIPCWPSYNDIKMSKLPCKFGFVAERFHCNSMGLETLEGCPKIIEKDGQPGDFDCENNNLTNLDFLPEEIGWLKCYNNKLENLYALKPQKVDNIIISYNEKLPVLKLLLIKEKAMFNRESITINAEIILKIINEHRNKYEDINERIYMCREELKERGYRRNAKW
jgi:hypothetical protein